MPGRSALSRLLLACAALAASCAAPRASGQAQVADLREDVRDLSQRLNELSLRVEELEHENAGLRAKITAAEGARDSVTPAQLNSAVADQNASVKAAVAASRSEILQLVASQMENLAKQTNAALDSVTKQGPAPSHGPAPAQVPAAKTTFGDAFPKEGVSYTVLKGDSIGVIAKRTGAKSQDIIDANKLSDPSRIQAGQVLFIPGGK
jgi:LysM repeat protein